MLISGRPYLLTIYSLEMIPTFRLSIVARTATSCSSYFFGNSYLPGFYLCWGPYHVACSALLRRGKGAQNRLRSSFNERSLPGAVYIYSSHPVPSATTSSMHARSAGTDGLTSCTPLYLEGQLAPGYASRGSVSNAPGFRSTSPAPDYWANDFVPKCPYVSPYVVVHVYLVSRVRLAPKNLAAQSEGALTRACKTYDVRHNNVA
jgi:hypothetical protein